MHAWVAERRGEIRFGVQMFALPEDAEPTRRLLDAGRLADRLGLDAFFIGDHPGYATDPWVHLAALAVTTERITLGSVVNCVYHRHPAMLARLAADLDRLSTGRALLGLGIGWNAAEFAQLGLRFPPVPERQAALEEAIEIIRGVWSGEPFTFSGEHWHTIEGRVWPGPLQAGGLPLLIAGAGDRTLGQVARHADVSNFGAGRNVGRARTVEAIRERLAFLRLRCEAIGRPTDAILPSYFTTWLMLAETNEQAKAKLDRYYPNGMNEDQALTRIWGAPDRAVAYFDELIAAGMTYFVVQILDAGDLETMELLAREVLPRVAGA